MRERALADSAGLEGTFRQPPAGDAPTPPFFGRRSQRPVSARPPVVQARANSLMSTAKSSACSAVTVGRVSSSVRRWSGGGGVAGLSRVDGAFEGRLGDGSDNVGDVSWGIAGRSIDESVQVDRILADVFLPQRFLRVYIGRADGQDVVESAMTQKCRVEVAHRVGDAHEPASWVVI
jgi:hypothetical protein